MLKSKIKAVNFKKEISLQFHFLFVAVENHPITCKRKVYISIHFLFILHSVSTFINLLLNVVKIANVSAYIQIVYFYIQDTI